MDKQVNANRVVQILGQKIGNVEVQNAIQQAQLEEANKDDEQDSKS